jgi:RNA polymerase sigma-70 factor, ECF subfamily
MSYDQRHRIFKLFYRRYFKKIRLRVMRILYNEKDAADDITQEAFMRAYIHLDKIYKKNEFLKWVYTVSRNLSYNYKKKKRYNLNDSLDKKAAGPENAILLKDRIADNNPAPDEMAAKNEVLGIFREAVNRLSPNYRLAVQLCGIDGLTYNDAAIALRTSPGAIAHNLMRAKRELSSLITAPF